MDAEVWDIPRARKEMLKSLTVGKISGIETALRAGSPLGNGVGFVPFVDPGYCRAVLDS